MAPQIFQHSRTKMQNWVMNQGHGAKSALGDNQDYAYDNSASPQKTQVFRPQPSIAHHAAGPENSPPRYPSQHQSRMPIVNSNASSRAAGAAAARLPTATTRPSSARPSHQISHSREAPLSVQRKRDVSSEPLQNPQRQGQAPGPFWEGSTIEGSTLSEPTASNVDPRSVTQSRVPHADSTFKSRNMTRQQTKRDSDAYRAPFVIGDNGLINVIESSSPLTRRSSTPEVRARAASKGFGQDSDPYIEEIRYQTDVERTPPSTLSHRGARLPLRTTKRESFAERTTYPSSANEAFPSSKQDYQTPGDVIDYAPRDNRDHLRAPAAHDAHRSTMFENIDTPIASHQDLPESELDVESVDDQPTPKAAVKSTKPLSQIFSQPPVEPINRRLFAGESKGGKARNSLGESSMPRPGSEKRQSKTNTKKRSFDLDYDDSALAAMKYSELKGQDFDFDPAQAESHSAQRPGQGTLPEKLDHFLRRDTEAQSTFFTSMPVRDWDDSGDWFLEKFGDIMRRLTDTRKNKRRLVDDFEAEIAEREDAVRNKMYGIDQTLSELRNEGEVMMKNKELE